MIDGKEMNEILEENDGKMKLNNFIEDQRKENTKNNIFMEITNKSLNDICCTERAQKDINKANIKIFKRFGKNILITSIVCLLNSLAIICIILF